MERSDAAVRELEARVESAHAAGDRPLEARAMFELARVRNARGERDLAVVCLERALALARATGDAWLLGECLLGDAELLAGEGDEVRARARLDEAASSFDAAVIAARARGDLALALDAADRARAARQQLIGLHERARPRREAPPREQKLLERLYATSRRLLEEQDPERLVHAVLDGAVEAVNAERGFVLLAPEEEAPAEAGRRRAFPGGLRIAAARNFDRAEVRRAEAAVSSGVLGRALEVGRPVIIEDASLDAELAERSSVRESRLRSVACVPFATGRGVRGALYLDNRFDRGAFAPADLDALAAFAAHAAVALESARLHARARRERADLEEARARAEELARRLERDLVARPEPEPATLAPPGDLVGTSRAMQEVYRFVAKARDADLPVLIRGESGTGKELVARAIHSESARRKEPFVSESCAAIPEPLLESALFGHEPGAFTGATARRQGLFELAGAGTLFLDEIGELAPGSQAKLLRVLQERRVRRIGGSSEVAVHARVVAATNRDLEAMVRDGTFREDLYYRLNVLSVRLPPLRERREDVRLLLARFFEKAGKSPRHDPAALHALCDHAWPGNVRELENEANRLLALGGDTLRVQDLSPAILQRVALVSPASSPEVTTLEEGERRLLVAALRATGGNKVRAAQLLGIARGTLWHKLKHHKLDQ